MLTKSTADQVEAIENLNFLNHYECFCKDFKEN